MSRIKTKQDAENTIAVLIPAEIMKSFGILPGDEIDLTETDEALILRTTKEAEKSSEIAEATDKVFDRWNNVFVELARGADE